MHENSSPAGSQPAADGRAASPDAATAPSDAPRRDERLAEPTRRLRVRPSRLINPLPDLPDEEIDGFRTILRDWEARLNPIDDAERAVADTFACAAWRRRRLDAVDEQVLRSLARGQVPPAGMPSLSTLIRYRARLAKDVDVLKIELKWLWRLRPKAVLEDDLNPARFAWLLEMRRKDRTHGGVEDRDATAEPADRAAAVPPSEAPIEAPSEPPSKAPVEPPIEAQPPVAPAARAAQAAGPAEAPPARGGPSMAAEPAARRATAEPVPAAAAAAAGGPPAAHDEAPTQSAPSGAAPRGAAAPYPQPASPDSVVRHKTPGRIRWSFPAGLAALAGARAAAG